MAEFDDYLETLPDDVKMAFDRIRRIALEEIPEMSYGVSYAIPALMYRGKPVLSVIARKRFLSLYPFSGKVIDLVSEQLGEFEHTSGAIHFSLQKPLPEDLVRAIVAARVREIELAL